MAQNALRVARLRAGITQEVLARAAQVTSTTISRIERGATPSDLVAYRLAYALAEKLGVDGEQLLEDLFPGKAA